MFAGWWSYTLSLDARHDLLALLSCVFAVFRENNVPVFIDFGGLLGAVRHGGMIPWDDIGDVDISVLSSDYARIDKLRHTIEYQCPNSRMIARHDHWYLPAVTPFIIRRSAFRIFIAPWAPYYVDIADYDTTVDATTGQYVLRDFDQPSYPWSIPLSSAFPTKDCKFEHVTVQCPAKPEDVLEIQYGDWRTPRYPGEEGSKTVGELKWKWPWQFW